MFELLQKGKILYKLVAIETHVNIWAGMVGMTAPADLMLEEGRMTSG